MRERISVYRTLLVPALLLGSALAVVQAAEQGPRLAKATKWSEPKTWPNRKVPAAGDKVVIEVGKSVILDVSPPALNGVTINGKLAFADHPHEEHLHEWVIR